MSGDSPFALAEHDLVSLAAILDGQFADVREQHRALAEIRKHPETLTAATIDRCTKLYAQQRDALSQYRATLMQWEALPLTAVQRDEVMRLEVELRHLYTKLTEVLAMMTQWKQSDVNAQQMRGDKDVPIKTYARW